MNHERDSLEAEAMAKTGTEDGAADGRPLAGSATAGSGAETVVTPAVTSEPAPNGFYWTYMNGGSGENSMEMKRAKNKKPLCRKGKQGFGIWSQLRDSNPGPVLYESTALPLSQVGLLTVA